MFDNHVLNRLIAWKCVMSDISCFTRVANAAVHNVHPVILAEELEELSSFEFSHLLDEVLDELSIVDGPLCRKEQEQLEFYRELLRLAVVMKRGGELYVLQVLDWTLYDSFEHHFIRSSLEVGKNSLCRIFEDGNDRLFFMILDLYETSQRTSPETAIDSMVEYFEKEVDIC